MGFPGARIRECWSGYTKQDGLVLIELSPFAVSIDIAGWR